MNYGVLRRVGGSRVVLLTVLLASLLMCTTQALAARTLTISGILAWFAGDPLTAGAKRFLERHPDVELSFQGKGPEELSVQIAAGAPPELIGLTPDQALTWAVQGLIEPLTGYVERDEIDPGDFIPPAWNQYVWNGEVWAMPLIVDPNYALLRNKGLFALAGLDPDDPPETIDEFDVIFRRVLQYGSDGSFKQFALAPWDMIGGVANTTYTWGWAFGGQFVDYSTGEITADHPQNVAALEWLRSYYDQYYTPFEELRAKIVQGETMNQDDLFMNEVQAMYLSHSGGALEIVKARPDIDLGISTMPHLPEAGNPTWLGGWALCIPKGTKEKELAWEFIKELTATAEGTYDFSASSGWFTAYIPSPCWEEFQQDPLLGPFVEIVINAQHMRPVIPAQEVYSKELELAVTEYLNHDIHSAKEALVRVRERVEEEMAKIGVD